MVKGMDRPPVSSFDRISPAYPFPPKRRWNMKKIKQYCKSCGRRIYTGDFCDDDCRETYELEKLTKIKGKRWVKC